MVREVLCRGSHVGNPPPAVAEPHCPNCRGSSFAGKRAPMADVEGVLVYCTHCGAVVGWSALPANQLKPKPR